MVNAEKPKSKLIEIVIMKKFTFFMVIFLISASFASAQYFVGGSLNFKGTSDKTEIDGTSEKSSSTQFSFHPKGGIFHSEKLLFGAELSFSIRKDKTPGDPETIERTTGFGISPFARYYAFQMGKFSLFGEGQLSLYTSSTESESGGTTTEGPTNNRIRLSVFPGIAYNINEKIELEAKINGVNFGIIRNVSKQDVAGNEVKNINTDFGFGADLDKIVTTGNITVGAIIKF